jgi:hypothetical protein
MVAKQMNVADREIKAKSLSVKNQLATARGGEHERDQKSYKGKNIGTGLNWPDFVAL